MRESLPVARTPTHPFLFRIGDFPVRRYGAALSIAFAIGTAVAMRRARAMNLDAERVFECAMVVVVNALVGARLFHVWANPGEFEGVGGANRLWSFDSEAKYTGVVGLSVMGGNPLNRRKGIPHSAIPLFSARLT